MRSLWNKSIVVGIVAAFICISLAPTISAIYQKNEQTQKTQIKEQLTPKYVQLKKTDQDQNEILSFISEISNLKNKFNNIMDLLTWLMNRSDFPLLTFLLTRLLQGNMFQENELIISTGWSYNLNLINTPKMKLIKPITAWMYRESRQLNDIPSATLVIQQNPFNIKTVFGNQLGLMFRFKGIYGQVPRDLPSPSFTYIIGYAKTIMVADLPEM